MNVYIKRNIKLPILVAMTVLVIGAGAAIAGPFHGGHGPHGMFNPLERLVDHVDLTDEQEEAIEEIFADMKAQAKYKQRFEMMKSFALLDPDDPSYAMQVEEKANAAAEEVRAKIIQMNATRKAVYDILDPEQKEELNKVIEKKMAKMEKRIAKHFD